MITLSAGETANSLTFNDLYSLLGGSLALTAGAVTVDLTQTLSAIAVNPAPGAGPSIGSVLTGTAGLTKGGSGDLFLTGTNTFTGTVTVNAGTLGALNDTAFGTMGGIGTAGANTITVNGGTLQLIGASSNQGAGTFQVNRTITVGSLGATLDVPSAGGNNAGSVTLESPNAIVAGSAGAGSVLTKTGQGQFFVVNANNYNGSIVLATSNGSTFDIRGTGALTAASGVTINAGASLNIDNNSTLANAVGPLASPASNLDRVANSTVIALNGGTLFYNARNLANSIREVVGATGSPVTLNQGQSQVTVNANGQGGELEIGNLARTPVGATPTINGGGTVNFGGNGTFGTAGNNGRVFITSINGGAGPADQAIVGGWATVGAEFAGYTTANGVIAASNALFTGVTATMPGSSSTTANVRLTGAGVVPDASASSGVFTINSLNMAGTTAGAVDLTFTTGTATGGDTLTLASGGFLSGNANRAVGTAAARGQITSGGRELFFHINGSTTTVNAVVIDNGSGAVTVVKDQGGTLSLAAANTYTGGTYSQGGGAISTGGTADVTYLGTGPVFINNAFLNQGARGATSSAGGYTVVNNGQIVLTSTSATGAGVYQADGDRYSIAGGSTIYANSPGAGGGFNSLTRVASFSPTGGLAGGAGGQVILAPDAIVAYNLTNAAGQGSTAPTQGTGVLAIQNLGTNADLYFSPRGGTGGQNNIVVVGAGTAYRGLSTDRQNDTGWQGTIQANSDFNIQGLVLPGTNRTFQLGGGNPVTITNTSTGNVPIKSFLIGNVTINTGVNFTTAGPNLPSNLTFVGTPGSQLVLQGTGALGADTAIPANNAAVIMQAGSIFNLFPDRPIVNGSVTLQAGSRFLGDDNAVPGTTVTGGTSLGSIGGPGSMTFEKGAIFDLTQAYALSGNTTLNWQPGSILRLNNSSSPVGIGSRVGPAVVFEIFNGNPSLTNGAGAITTITPVAAAVSPENVSVSGATFTNDSNGRTLSSGYGRILIGAGGATIAATTNTTFSFNDDFDLGNNTLTIGTSESIAGNPKTAPAPVTGLITSVNLNIGGSKAAAGATITVSPNYVFNQGAQNALPDLATVNLQSGAFLRLSQNNFTETIGGLSGAGNVTTATNQNGLTLQAGLNGANTTFSGLFSTTADPNAVANSNLIKVGAGTLTITNGGGASQATQWANTLSVNGGGLTLGGNGALNFATNNVNRTGTLTLDNAGVALSNRLGGNTKTLNLGGGTLTLTGNASTAVTEAVSALNVNLGGTSVVNLNSPGAGLTLNATTLGGRSISTVILRGQNLGATPGAGVSTFVSATPNLAGTVAAGTITTALRPDILSDTPSTGGTAPLGFVTQDNATNGFRRLVDSTEYTTAVVGGASTNNNVQLSAPVTVTASPSPASPAADTQIQTLVLNAGATSIQNNAGATLTNAQTRFRVGSGGVLVQPGVNTAVSTPYFDSGTVFYFHTYGNLDLAQSGPLLGSGLTKSGTGNLTLGTGGTSVLTGNIAVNDGTLKLGANSPFFFNTGGAVNQSTSLWMSAGTLDLNGNSVLTGNLTSSNANLRQDQPGVGGNIVNTGAAPLTLTAFGNNYPFNGTLGGGGGGGAISFQKVGNSDTTFTNTNTYTGPTTLRGGSITLRSQGTLVSNNFALNFGTLSLDNFNGIVNPTTGLYNIDNRIPTNSTLTLRGAGVQLLGAPGEASQQQLQSVTLDAGANFIGSNAGQSGSTDLTIGNLVRSTATPGVTLDFRGSGSTGRYAPTTTLTNGSASAIPGMNQDSHIVLTQINGQVPSTANGLAYNAAAPVGTAQTANGFMGGWVTLNQQDFAAYQSPAATPNTTTGGGIGAFGSGNGFPTYTAATATGGTGFASGNVTNIPNIDVTLPAGGATTGALRIGDNAARTLSFTAAGDTLNLETGGLLRTNNNNGTTIGSTTVRGRITAGGATPAAGTAELYLHFNSSQNITSLTSNGVSTTTAPNNVINSVIVDNGSTPVRVVKDLGGSISLTAFNTYTGGTVVNGGTILLASTATATGTTGGVVIPGDLTINNATVTMLAPDQILRTANVAINNNGTLQLPNTGGNTSTTLNNLTFNNVGGAGNPNTNNNGGPAATAVVLTNTLVVTGNVTAVNDSPSATPTFNGVSTSGTGATLSASVTVIDFGAGAGPNGERAVTVATSGLSPIGLSINAGIARGSIIKTGPTMLALNAPTTSAIGGVTTNLPTSTFSGGVFVNQGAVRVDNANSLSINANTVTVGTGAAGTGAALVINTGTAIPATVSTVLNNGTLAPYANNITLNGSVAVSADSTIGVNDYYQTTTARNVTIAGALTGAGALLVTASPVSGQNGTLSLSNPANAYTGAVTMQPNAIVTANSTAGAGNVFTTGPVTMQGGTLNLRDSGSGNGTTITGYGNNLTVTGNATLTVDRSTVTNTGNTLQLGNLTLNNATLTTNTGGNQYQMAFGTTTVIGANAAINHTTGSPVNVGSLTGAGTLTKYGGSQVNVTAASAAFTGGTTVAQGTLRVAASGTALGTGALSVQPGAELRADPTTGTVTFAPSSIQNDGLIRVTSGTANFGAQFINGTPGPSGTAQLSAIAERYYRPNSGALATTANFSGNSGDPFITFSNATNFLTATPTQGTSTFTAGNFTFTSNQLIARAGSPAQTVTGFAIDEQFGASFRGTLTVGGVGNAIQPGTVVSFGTASDDGSSLYVDLNRNGTFEASELVVNNLGGHGYQSRVGAAQLATAGDYDYVIGFYNGTGANQNPTLEARLYPGGTLSAPIPYASQAVLNPTAGATTFGPTSSITVDTGATMTAAGFKTGVVTLNGTATLAITAPATASSTTTLVNTGAGTLDVGGTTATNHVLTVGVLSISGSQTLTKQGVGTMLVNGAGAGTGTLTVAAGRLGGVGSIAGPVGVNAAAVLDPGTINGTTTPAPGVLTIAGALTLDNAARYAVEVGGTTPGNSATNYDQTNVTAATGTPLSIAGAVLDVTGFGGFTSANPAQAYYILTQGGTAAVSGEFANAPEGQLVTFSDGTTGRVTYLANWTGDQATSSLTGGNDVAVYAANVVPEPGTAGVLA
ncbi:MAG TPA: autotransporter-associated beta strand repeat-containing protein, partial [Humisphaera sp.]